MYQYDVIVLGESLIDFIPTNDTEEIKSFNAIVGGAPTNVSYGLAKLENKVGLISRVGKDPLGESIINTIKKGGVDTSLMQQDSIKHTPVTIVMPRSIDMFRYLIYRDNSADGYVSYDEIPKEIFKNSKVFHCGTLIMASPVASKTTIKAIQSAKKNNVVVSIDVNLRVNSWKSKTEMIKQTKKIIADSDILKMTKEECDVLNIDPKKISQNNDQVILVTDGARGASLYYKNNYVYCQAPSVKAIDVTGAGDAFTAAFLSYYLKNWTNNITKDLLQKSLCFAVYAGAKAVQKYGGIESLPDTNQIKELQEKHLKNEAYTETKIPDVNSTIHYR